MSAWKCTADIGWGLREGGNRHHVAADVGDDDDEDDDGDDNYANNNDDNNKLTEDSGLEVYGKQRLGWGGGVVEGGGGGGRGVVRTPGDVHSLVVEAGDHGDGDGDGKADNNNDGNHKLTQDVGLKT